VDGDVFATCLLQPAPVPGVDHAERLFSRFGATCALREDRSLVCWGRVRPAPTAFRDVLDVSMGREGPCTARADGSVWCQTRNDDELRVDGITGARRVALSEGEEASSYGCAIVARGAVACWTYPFEDPRSGPVLAAAPVDGIDGASDIIVDDWIGCVRTESGTVACWTMPAGRHDASATIARATRVPLPPATSLVMSGSFPCVSARDGTVWCGMRDAAIREIPGLRGATKIFTADGGQVWGSVAGHLARASWVGEARQELLAEPGGS
jgi:hypothetical protein